LVKKRDYEEDIDYERTLLIDSPPFLLSHSLKKPWDTFDKIKEYFSINAVDSSKSDVIKVTPYRFANVYSSGTICFGEIVLIGGMPQNLRQANNFFWATPFNEDNSPFFDIHSKNCDSRTHDYYDHYDDFHRDCSYYALDDIDYDFDACSVCPCCKGECNCRCMCECCEGLCACRCRCDLTEKFFSWIQNYSDFLKTKQFTVKTKHFCGKKYFGYPKHASSVFISNSEELKDRIPEKHWRKDAQDTNVVIGVANLVDGCWNIDLGSHKFQITTEQIVVL
jgi:hypothetical protein